MNHSGSMKKGSAASRSELAEQYRPRKRFMKSPKRNQPKLNLLDFDQMIICDNCDTDFKDYCHKCVARLI